jgi:K+-transporting ATPase KdpF subunit
MLFDYVLGGIVSLGILVYLVYALARPEKF